MTPQPIAVRMIEAFSVTAHVTETFAMASRARHDAATDRRARDRSFFDHCSLHRNICNGGPGPAMTPQPIAVRMIEAFSVTAHFT
jgi:hypothetical protein